MRRFIFIVLCLLAAVSLPLVALADSVPPVKASSTTTTEPETTSPLDTKSLNDEIGTTQMQQYEGRVMSLDLRADRAIERATTGENVANESRLNDSLVRVESTRKQAHAELTGLQKSAAPQSIQQRVQFDRKVRLYEAAIVNAEEALNAH